MIRNATSASGNSLNALNFPMGQASMEPTPFASDTHALLRTTQTPGWGENHHFPTGEYRFGLFGNDSLHPLHIDSNGLGTFVYPLTGSKLWISARSLDMKSLDSSIFEDIDLLNRGFQVEGAGFKKSTRKQENSPRFALEAVFLQPGTRL